jgi:hypothetical protein
MMMPPYYHPTYNSDVSSIDDSSSDDEIDNNNFVGHNYIPTDIISRCAYDYQDDIDRSNDYDSNMIQDNYNYSNNNTTFRPSKRANVHDCSATS